MKTHAKADPQIPTEVRAGWTSKLAVLGPFTNEESHLPRMLETTAKTAGIVFLIIATAPTMGWVLTKERVPETIASSFLSITQSKVGILLLVNILMLIAGMFMDIAAALIILGPILHPLAVSVSVNHLHFGIIMVLSLNIALMTPTVGACLFVACGISKLTLEQLSKAIWPFIVAEVIVLFLITFFADIPLLIPRLLGLA